MSERLNDSDDTLPLHIASFYGGTERGTMIQLTGDAVTQLTESQVQALVQVLTNWLYKQKLRRGADAICSEFGTTPTE